jgi:hypothetical protein
VLHRESRQRYPAQLNVVLAGARGNRQGEWTGSPERELEHRDAVEQAEQLLSFAGHQIWLSILVRKLLRRGNFRSVQDLRDQVLAFIAYFNRTMAKPFKWTYQGTPLHA